MLFAVIFTDKPGHGTLRAEHLNAHIGWVAEHQDTVLVAGSLRVEPGAVPKGGLWVVDAPSKEAVLDLMQPIPSTCAACVRALKSSTGARHSRERCWCEI